MILTDCANNQNNEIHQVNQLLLSDASRLLIFAWVIFANQYYIVYAKRFGIGRIRDVKLKENLNRSMILGVNFVNVTQPRSQEVGNDVWT